MLADFVEVSPGYEEVVEEFLKQELECVVVEQHEQARSGIALLREEGRGAPPSSSRICLPEHHAHGQAHTELLAEPGVVAPVRELMTLPEVSWA